VRASCVFPSEGRGEERENIMGQKLTEAKKGKSGQRKKS
jgi:hypothetical protein